MVVTMKLIIDHNDLFNEITMFQMIADEVFSNFHFRFRG